MNFNHKWSKSRPPWGNINTCFYFKKASNILVQITNSSPFIEHGKMFMQSGNCILWDLKNYREHSQYCHYRKSCNYHSFEVILFSKSSTEGASYSYIDSQVSFVEETQLEPTPETIGMHSFFSFNKNYLHVFKVATVFLIARLKWPFLTNSPFSDQSVFLAHLSLSYSQNHLQKEPSILNSHLSKRHS